MADSFFQMLPTHGTFPWQHGEAPAANTGGLGKLPHLPGAAWLHRALSSPSQQGRRKAGIVSGEAASEAHCVPFCSPVPILEVEITTDTNFIINHLVWGSSLPSVNWPHPFLRGWVLKAEERLAALKVVIHQRWWERKLETLKYGEGSIPGGCCSKAKQRAWATGRVWMFVLLTASVSNLVPRAES